MTALSQINDNERVLVRWTATRGRSNAMNFTASNDHGTIQRPVGGQRRNANLIARGRRLQLSEIKLGNGSTQTVVLLPGAVVASCTLQRF